jgi:hypothetical protein
MAVKHLLDAKKSNPSVGLWPQLRELIEAWCPIDNSRKFDLAKIIKEARENACWPRNVLVKLIERAIRGRRD